MKTLRFILSSAFLLSVSIVNARPGNDTCESATSINRLPFEANVNRRRTLRSASQDEFAVACNPPLFDNVVEEDSKFAVYRTLVTVFGIRLMEHERELNCQSLLKVSVTMSIVK